MERKNWLITGTSSGIGQALADAVVQKGDFVIRTFRKQTQVNEFNQKGIANSVAILLDITQLKSMEASVQAIITKYHRIDVLVNNAGVGFIGAVEEASSEEISAVFDTNVFGTLKLTQLILPHMRRQKSGHIVQISSQSGIKASAGFGIYNASKFALEGFSEALAEEVKPLGIHVTLAEPGPFRTKFAGSSLWQADKQIEDYDETAGAFREKLKHINGKQEGDPSKAASAIINHLYSDSPTLRLPLGKMALEAIQTKLDSVKADLEFNRTVAENAVHTS